MALFVISTNINAASITSTGTGGLWNAISTWTGGVVPGSGDDVTIATGTTVTLDADKACTNLTLNGTLADAGHIITVSGNIGGASPGTHSGNGRLKMTSTATTPTIATGLTLGSLYVNTTNNVTPSGNITISNDLLIKTGGITDNGKTVSIGGNIYNLKGGYITMGNASGGRFSMTGTSTVSGLMSVVVSGGSGWTAGATVTFNAPSSGITATGTITAAGVITITEPGSGYTTAPTSFTGGGSGAGTFTYAIGAGSTKYITPGGGTTSAGFNIVNLELANTVANNQVILGSGTDNYFTIYLNGVLSFSAGNTSGKLILSKSLSQGNPTALGIGNNGNGSISMASGNAIGTVASGYGKLYLNTTLSSANAGGTIYFDQTTPGTTNNFRDVQAYRPNNTIGNNLIISNSFTFSGGTASTSFYKLIVGAGANLTVPSFSITLPSGSPYTLDASASSATLTVTGNGATIAPSTLTLTSSTIGNLVVAGSNTLITGQNLTIGNSLILTSGTVNNSTNNISLSSGATITRTAGALSAAPVFGSTVNIIYNGISAQSSSYELPAAITSAITNLTTNAAGLTLNNAPIVNGVLTLNGKLISATGKDLTLGSSATITGVSLSNYIDLSNGANLIRKAVSSNATLFPIGGTNYTPLTLTNTTNSPDITATVGTAFTNAPKDVTKCVTLQWSLTGSLVSSSDISYQFNGANGGSAFSTSTACDLGTYSLATSSWNVNTVGTPSGANPYTFSVTGFPILTTANKYVIGNTGQVLPSSEIISTWSGAVDTDWTNAGNWSANGVPGSTISAIIPSGLSTYPTISGAQQVNNLTIQSGATITNNGTLQLIGQVLTLNGSVAGTGTTEFAGINPQAITGNASFSNIKLNNSTGVVNNGTLTINGSVTVNTGVLSGTAPVYETNTPVTFIGSNATGAGLILNPSSGNVGLLTINGAGTFTLSANTSVTALALTAGTLADGGFTLTNTGNITATTGVVSGTGRIKLTGTSTTVSGSTFAGLEIAAGIGNTITANSSMTIGNLILTSGIFNDNGNILTVSGNVDGTSGIHAGNGRLKLTGSNPTIATGLTLGSLYVNLVTGTVTTSGTGAGYTISNDLILKSGNITDNAKVISIGGNIYNLEGAYVTLANGNASTGKFSMTGTSTISGLTSANAAGSSWTAGTITFTAPASGVAASGTITTAGVITITEPGSGYTTAPTAFTGSSSGTATTTIGSTTAKYITCGGGTTSIGLNITNLELANTQANNQVILSSGTDNWFALYVSGTLSFSAGNSTGKIILNTSLDNAKQTQLSIGNNSTGNIVMASTNAIGTAAAGYGKLYLNTNISGINGGGTLYFDQSTPGTTNYFRDMQCFRSNNTIGNDLKIQNSIAIGGGSASTNYTLTVGSGANFSISSISMASPGATGIYAIDASNANATVTFTGNNVTTPIPSVQTNAAGLFYSSTLGATICNLATATGAGTLTLGQSLSVTGNVNLATGSTLQAGSNSLSLSGNSTGDAASINCSGATVTCNGISSQTLNLGTVNNLVINNAAGIVASPNVTGLLTLTNGDVSDYSNLNNCSVLFNGSTAQTANTGISSVNNMTINNAAGVTLSSAPTVNGVLTLTSGKLILGNNNLTIWTSGSVVASTPATSYIATTGTGNLVMSLNASATTTFPIGTSTTYNPVTLTPTSATNFYVNVKAGNIPALPLTDATILSTKSLNRTWTITPSSPSATSVTLGYSGSTDNNIDFDNSGADVALLHYNNSGAWEYVGSGSVIPGAGSVTSKAVTFDGINAFSPFTIVNPGPSAVYINTGGSDFSDQFRSVGNGNWNSSSTWELYDNASSTWLPTVLTPTVSSTATILNGDTVTITTQAGIGTLTIENGAVLKSSANAYNSAPIVLSIGKAGSVIRNNGIFGCPIGSATSVGGDGIALAIAANCTSFSLIGSGSTGIGSLYTVAGSNNLIAVIDQNVQFRYSTSGTKKTALTLVDPTATAFTGSRTLVVNAGKTVSFLNNNSCLHGTTFSSAGSYSEQQGNITYDIQGTLDLKGGSVYVTSSTNASSSAQVVKLNVGKKGSVIVAGDFSFCKVQATQAVYINLEDSAYIDASSASVSGTNFYGPSTNVTSGYGSNYVWVITNGSSSYSRNIGNGGTKAKYFNVAVSPTNGDYVNLLGNPIYLSNNIYDGEVFTVNVNPGHPYSFTAFSTNYSINRTWMIKPTKIDFSSGANVLYGFTGTPSTDGNSSFSPTLAASGFTTGSTDILFYIDFVGNWSSMVSPATNLVPTTGTFGTAWQLSFFLGGYTAPYLHTLRNKAAPKLCN